MNTIAIALLVIGVIGVLFTGCTTAPSDAMMEKDSGAMEQTPQHNNDAMMEKKDDGAMQQTDSMMDDKDDDAMMEENDAMEQTDSMMGKKDDDSMMMTSFSGTKLADESKSKYIAFNEEDYNKALEEGKIIVLNFYASWCPSCTAEQPKAIAAFNDLDNENVVGFRVNYKDSDTEDAETQLAKDFGISYQHTKVILKDGERVLKSPESWSSERYASEINTFT